MSSVPQIFKRSKSQPNSSSSSNRHDNDKKRKLTKDEEDDEDLFDPRKEQQQKEGQQVEVNVVDNQHNRIRTPNTTPTKIDTIDGTTISSQDFYMQYIAPRKPCILTNLLRYHNNNEDINHDVTSSCSSDNNNNSNSNNNNNIDFGQRILQELLRTVPGGEDDVDDNNSNKNVDGDVGDAETTTTTTTKKSSNSIYKYQKEMVQVERRYSLQERFGQSRRYNYNTSTANHNNTVSNIDDDHVTNTAIHQQKNCPERPQPPPPQDRQCIMSIPSFLRDICHIRPRHIKDNNNHDNNDKKTEEESMYYYLSTQEQVDDSDNEETNEEQRPPKPFYGAPCHILHQQGIVPMHSITKLAGQLVLSSINIWMGYTPTRPTPASSRQKQQRQQHSGLHFDYHDNFYCLVYGQKEFVLYPPSCAPYLVVAGGRIHQIHTNGLISFHRNPIQADGRSILPIMNKQEKQQQQQPNENKNIRSDNKDKNTDGIHLNEDYFDDDDDEDEEGDDDGDDDEEEIVLGKGFDYKSSSDDEKNDNEDDDDIAPWDAENESENDDFNDSNDFVDDGDDDKDKKRKTNSNKYHDSESLSREQQHQQCSKDDDGDIQEPLLPPNFSWIDPIHATKEQIIQTFPIYAQCPIEPCRIVLLPNQCLYLPASWFHCVVSSGSNGSDNDNSADDKNDKSSVIRKNTDSNINNNNKNDDGTITMLYDVPSSVHMAINYWYHPPDNLNDYHHPYIDRAYWEDTTRPREIMLDK